MTNDLMKPGTLDQVLALAKVLADSDLVPKEYRGKPANCVVAIQMGASIGLDPFQSVQSIAVINGKPGLYGDAGLAAVQASGLLEDFDETDDGETATCTMKRKGVSKAVVRTFSAADAMRVTMYERDQQGNLKKQPLGERLIWRNHPKRMRQWRARWWAMRDLFADVLKGLVGAEEIEEATVIDVTPEPAEAAHAELEPKEKAILIDIGALPKLEIPDAPPMDESVPAAAAPESTGGDQSLTFELNGIRYVTRGITRQQMLECFTLRPKANNAAKDKAYDKKLLKEKYGLETTKDLTEEQATAYLLLLRDAIDGDQA